jgi:hypothetical protein
MLEINHIFSISKRLSGNAYAYFAFFLPLFWLNGMDFNAFKEHLAALQAKIIRIRQALFYLFIFV